MKRRTFLAGSFLAALAAGCSSRHRPQHLEVSGFHTEYWFLNVGYGDAIIVRRGNHGTIIDGGYPVTTPSLLKTLEILGIKRFDSAVITHPHPDHIGGVYGILESGIETEKILGIYNLENSANPEGFREYLNQHPGIYGVARRGDRHDLIDGISAEILHPAALVADMNDSSMVLKTGEPGSGVLLCGDIGVNPQNELVKTYGTTLASQVIKMPHHGGDISTDFLDMVNPEFAVISAGINPYGNPKAETLEKLNRRNTTTLRTDTHGTVLFRESRGTKLEFVPRGTNQSIFP